ncbi:hypothetical protein [Kitasatospora sp. NPDC057015]|uniref:hypothetical protein n=1 Tax=Kitasatospora sp. NPDC057015 TaxID=3346001 RepID=UPI003645446F
MLVLGDRAFGSNDLLTAITEQGAQFLVRCTSSRRFPVLALLQDGSYLTRVADLTLRVVEAEVRAHTADGSRITGTYRLLTTLVDHRTDPAGRVVHLVTNAGSWDSSFLALRHTLLKGRVLRSKAPVGLVQEMGGILALYQALRSAMVTAVETVPGCDPDRAAFTVALEAARDTVVQISRSSSTQLSDRQVDLVGNIGAAVLSALMPPRRPRVSARVVKCGISRYHTWNRDGRPLASIPVTALDIAIHPPALPTAQTTVSPKAQGCAGRWTRICTIMMADTDRPWTAPDLAQQLGINGPKPVNSLSIALGRWARQGLLERTARATYRLTRPDTWTPAPSP